MEYKTQAYGNYPLPLGFGQTISQPLTVAFMLELLKAQPGERVLDIGAGSGWQTGLLAWLVSANYSQQTVGRVVALERIPELAEMARQNIAAYNFLNRGVAQIVTGDGSRGYLLEAPFDKIVAAATANSVPAAWLKQLKVGGRLVAPIKESIVVWDKISPNEFRKEEYNGFRFVPLVQG